MKKKVSIGERSFTLFNNTFLILLALICIVPFLNIIATSFASTQEVVAKKFILFPTTFSLDAYRYILSTPTIFRALAVSIGVTGVGTIVSMCATSLVFPESICLVEVSSTFLLYFLCCSAGG